MKGLRHPWRVEIIPTRGSDSPWINHGGFFVVLLSMIRKTGRVSRVTDPAASN